VSSVSRSYAGFFITVQSSQMRFIYQVHLAVGRLHFHHHQVRSPLRFSKRSASVLRAEQTFIRLRGPNSCEKDWLMTITIFLFYSTILNLNYFINDFCNILCIDEWNGEIAFKGDINVNLKKKLEKLKWVGDKCLHK
jgi:hypothetical protein